MTYKASSSHPDQGPESGSRGDGLILAPRRVHHLSGNVVACYGGILVVYSQVALLAQKQYDGTPPAYGGARSASGIAT